MSKNNKKSKGYIEGIEEVSQVINSRNLKTLLRIEEIEHKERVELEKELIRNKKLKKVKIPYFHKTIFSKENTLCYTIYIIILSVILYYFITF